MPTARLPISVAIAACAFALPAMGDSNTIELQITPAGEFTPRDGRDMPVAAWRIDATSAQRVIERFNARKSDTVVDYEHQTLKAADNGKEAPAAAWIKKLEWREGQGLYGTVELTNRARGYIAANEYRYFSPVFQFSKTTGDVLSVLMGAITNDPAVDGMEPLALRAAASFNHLSETETTEEPMNKLLAAICAALVLNATTTEDQAIAALSALKPKLDERDSLRKALGIADTVASDTAIAACTAIKTKADTGAGEPDPAKYVAVGVVEELKTQVAALSAQHVDRQVSELVTQGLDDGRILPAQKDWATSLGKKDIAALTSYLATAQPIAALTRTQTANRVPPTDPGAALTDAELAVCTNTGITPDAFKKARAA
ncbi:MAG: phage protease [Betaproteobacteria bacterium]